MLGTLCISTSPPLLLFSLLTCSFSLFSLLLASAEAVVDSPASGWAGLGRGGAVQRGISQRVPVKLFSLKPPLAHRRQGLPERSRARRPALIAPVFAFGPSLCEAPRPLGRPDSAAPSSL